MIIHESAELKNLAIHYIGVAHQDDALTFSQDLAHCADNRTEAHLLHYLCSSFKSPEFFGFDTAQDSLYPIIQKIFEDKSQFFSQSKVIAERLYQKSEHPAIKSGELVIAYLDNVVLEDECLSAIAIFKLENKNTFLQINEKNETYEVTHDMGLFINQAEKGCLIFNSRVDDGYKIVTLDKKSRVEANYWAKDFLNISPLSDDYHFTENYIQMTKSFLEDTAKKEGNISKVDHADILNKSQSFFSENIEFNEADYQDTIFESPDMSQSFNQYKKEYQEDHDVALANEFEISDSAVKNNAKVFKSVIKLDKNFHIYVHGDREKIQKGQDNEGRKYYKIFYEEEK